MKLKKIFIHTVTLVFYIKTELATDFNNLVFYFIHEKNI